MTAEPLWTAEDQYLWSIMLGGGRAPRQTVIRRDVYETEMRNAVARRAAFLLQTWGRSPRRAVEIAATELGAPHEAMVAVASFARSSCEGYGADHDDPSIDRSVRFAVIYDLKQYASPCRRRPGRPTKQRMAQ